ncbi:MAG: hypothetical protein ACFFHD_16005 [Promethearchaeota archaeon]
MKNKISRISLLISVLIILGIFFISATTIGFEQNSNKKTSNPKLSYVATVDYNEYVSIYSSSPCGSGDEFYWEFSGSNHYVGITVMAMDSSEYYNFQYGYTYYYYSQSNGNYYGDSGSFYPTYTDTWYIVFVNWDSDVQSTVLTYSGSVYYGDDGDGDGDGNGGIPIFIIIGIIIAIVAAISITGLIIYKVKKKKREPSIPTEPGAETPVTPEEPLSYTKIIDGIKNVFDVSGNRIDLEMLREIVPMDKPEFNAKILDLAKQYGFKIELEVLHISDEKRDDFIDALINAIRQ